MHSQNDVVRELVDITCLPLNYIKEGAGVVRIGATTTLQTVAENPLLTGSVGHSLSEAALLCEHSRMVRNVSTVGGVLVSSGPLSVFYCASLALQAQVRITGGEEFALAMNIFLNKKGVGGGLLVEIIVPRMSANTYSSLAPIVNRRGQVIICASARMTVQKGKCSKVKVALTGCPVVPQRMPKVEALVEGQPATEAVLARAADASYESYFPVSDDLASEEFRKEVSRVVVKKALLSCLEQAEEDL